MAEKVETDKSEKVDKNIIEDGKDLDDKPKSLSEDSSQNNEVASNSKNDDSDKKVSKENNSTEN